MMALSGITVLDLARRYPGAYTAMFLGDFGANVIKVDPPTSTLPPNVLERNSEEFSAHFAQDRNKRSIVLNLRKEGARDVFFELVKRADVLIDGFRPQVMPRLGVGYDTLKEVNPRLVYCLLSGYGPDGPYAALPGHDMNYVGIAGALNMIGPRNGPPYFASNYLADMAGAGLHGVIGILMALQARERTGKGQFVDVAYIDGVISLMTSELSYYFYNGIVPRRGETRTNGGAPWAQIFKCKDGKYFTVGCAEPNFWANLCRAVGKDHLASRHQAPLEEVDGIVAELAEVFLTRTRDEWFEFFKDKETCVGPVLELDEAIRDPQVLHRKMVIEADHPKLGKIRQIGIPIKLSDTPGQVRTLGTPNGTYTDAILGELGYKASDIGKLRSAGIVE